MATRADFDAALLALGAAIDDAVARVTSGASITDQDIATLKADTVKVQGIAGGATPSGGLFFAPPVIIGGGTVVGTIRQGVPAAASGENFVLTSDSVFATVPANVTVGAGAATVDFSVSTVAVSTSTKVTVTAVSPFHSFTGTFTINP